MVNNGEGSSDRFAIAALMPGRPQFSGGRYLALVVRGRKERWRSSRTWDFFREHENTW